MNKKKCKKERRIRRAKQKEKTKNYIKKEKTKKVRAYGRTGTNLDPTILLDCDVGGGGAQRPV
jgi:hypothetical protein